MPKVSKKFLDDELSEQREMEKEIWMELVMMEGFNDEIDMDMDDEENLFTNFMKVLEN